MLPQNEDDRRFMRRAIHLSKRGFPAPNPRVGCVIANRGEIVGEGYHDHAGGPHAEVVALNQAGDAARGGDAYVTLEPCDHHGRTPPCSLALAAAGVRRVVVAVEDPNSRAAGGVERLRAAGIEVEVGLMANEAAAENRLFLAAMRNGRPYVVGKAAMSLDGRIALPNGDSKWITGDRARDLGHRLRAECGAVLVGRRTVEMDDPLLTARVKHVVNQPLRIVLDPGAKLGPHYRVFGPDADTWHVTGNIDIGSILDELKARGHIGLLVEGGGVTIGRFLSADAVDELRLFIGARVLGAGSSWVEDMNVASLAEAPRFEVRDVRKLGPDTELIAYRSRQ